jgi:cobalt/nickel transport system ATP-binding protein
LKKVIEIKKLSYFYTDGTRALKDVCLDIYQGETVAIIGPNGAGKSTLLLHLNGVLRGKSNSIVISGMRMEESNLREIRSKVAVVFQDPDDQLFSPTVFDDVAFGPLNMGLSKDVVMERVKKALRQVDMEGYEDRCPHHLSLGEKRRISLATVLSMEPEILVLDEPTANLDPRARRGLITLLSALQITKIIATHDMELAAETCSKTVLLSEGRVVANGNTRDILTNEEFLKAHGLEPPPPVRIFKLLGYKDIPLIIDEIRKGSAAL